MNHLVLASALASIAITTTAAADPRPTDAKLAQLVGHWQGGGAFTFQGKKLAIEISYACQRAAIGPAIACTAAMSSKDFHYEEDHLLGYDRATDTYHLFSVNDLGEAYDHAGKWSDAATVSFQFDGKHDGKPVHETYTYEFKGKTQLVMKGTMTIDGKVIGDGMYTIERAP
jgi:hypothetical protein